MVRRARWWSRLGLISHPRCLPAQLGSIFSDGGLIGCLTVVLTRVYPLIYFERSSGTSCFRGEKAHLRLVKENQQSKETTLHQGLLTASQIDLARSWHQEQADKKRSKINAEVHRRLNKKQKLYEAVPVLKLRIMDTDGSCAILSVWRPPEELQQTLSEGRMFRIFYAWAAGYRRDCLQLTATRQTRWEDIGAETGHSFPDCDRHVTPLCLTLSKNLHPVWNEVDVVGLVFRIDQMDQGSQLVYIVDHHLNILALKFWGGLKECGVEDIVSCESMLSVSNCSWRGYYSGRCACVHVTELSVVSISPRHPHLVEAFDHLKKNIEDVKALIYKADMKLDGFKDESSLHTDGAIIQNHCPQAEENMDSPVAKSVNQIAESTTASAPNINRRAERSREIRSRLNSLVQYGTPSPLTGVAFNNPSPKTWKPFKVPFKNSKS
ncbi:breast cancer type 2 susceptibility protein-like [Palaemon carinicauda]|uniref:breast cancer type 2 susceptibility protein-like n=1 Tax=Palaemon carinicauda TaxID=392227 RepID=UPI0035B6374C